MDPRHTFGGRGLDRLIFDFEPELDGGAGALGGDAGAAPSPETADAGAAGEAVSSSAATDAAPAWSPDDPQFREVVANEAAEIVNAQLEPLLPLLQALMSGGGGQPQPVEQQGFDWTQLDPLDEGFGEQLGQGILAMVQQALNPVQQTIEQFQQGQQTFAQQQAEQQAAEAAQAWIAADFERNGPLSDKAAALIRPLAQQLYPRYESLYGYGDRAAERAFAEAAQTVRAIVADARQGGATSEVERVDRLAGARQEPGAAGVAGVETFSDKPLSSQELALKYGSRAAALRAA